MRGAASEAAMIGRQTGDQAGLFYEFRLEDRIPKDHLLRRINVFVSPVRNLADMANLNFDVRFAPESRH
jgi:hypothetical protein